MIANYHWWFADGNSSTQVSPTHTYNQAGTYIVYLSLFDSLNTCFDSTSYYVTVPACAASFTYTQNVGGFVTFTGSTNASIQSFISWDFGDGNMSYNSLTAFHRYTSNGTYQVTLTVTDSLTNCIATYFDSVNVSTVIPPPSCTANFVHTTSFDTLRITNQAINFTSVTYDFGDGSGLSNVLDPTHIYQQSGTYLVCQTISDSNTACTDTYCDTIEIYIPPPCVASFNYVASNDTLYISNTAANYTRTLYTFGDGDSSTQADPLHVYAQSGTYNVCQTVWNDSTGCSDTFCDSILITRPADCKAGFTYQHINDSTYFTSTAISATSFKYYFGDGNSSLQENPVHEYAQSGQYVVTQIVYNNPRNCTDTILDTITINISRSCVAEYQIAIDTTKKNTLYLINTSSKLPSHQYVWDFGDGGTASGRTPIHNYQQSGKYEVCLTITDQTLGCWSQKCDSLGLDSAGNLLKSSGFVLRVLDGSFIGIEEPKGLESTLNLYPNPFSSELKIDIDTNNEKVGYEIYDLRGSLISRGNIQSPTTEIDLSAINKGTYIIRVFNSKETVVKKVIKQ